MKKIVAIFFALFVFFAITPSPANAQIFKEWGDCVDPSGVATLRCLPVVFQNVVTAFLMFAGAVALFMIIYSGIRLVTSGGDPKQVQSARQIMTYAIIGVIIVLCSFAIIYFIGYITNSESCITDLNKINDGGCK